MIVRIKKTTSFTTVDNEPINNRKLSYQALGLWLYLMSKPDGWNLNMTDLRKRDKGTGKQYGRDSISNILKELKNEGLAKLKQVRKDGKAYGSEWVIYEKAEIRKNRVSEKPSLGKSTPLVNTDNNIVNTELSSAAPIPKEIINPSLDIDPSQYITSVLDLTPQRTLDRWGMNYGIDAITIRDQMEAFANWYFMSLCEKLGEDEATERIMRMKLRALISAFETKFLRNYREAV